VLDFESLYESRRRRGYDGAGYRGKCIDDVLISLDLESTMFQDGEVGFFPEVNG